MMEVDMTAMPSAVPTAPPAPVAAANHDAWAAIIVVVTAAARIAVAAVIIGRRADSDAYAEWPSIESNLCHGGRRGSRGQKRRRADSKRKLSHLLLLLLLRVKEKRETAGARSANRAFCAELS
jgi:hypothetical protein